MLLTIGLAKVASDHGLRNCQCQVLNTLEYGAGVIATEPECLDSGRVPAYIVHMRTVPSIATHIFQVSKSKTSSHSQNHGGPTA